MNSEFLQNSIVEDGRAGRGYCFYPPLINATENDSGFPAKTKVFGSQLPTSWVCSSLQLWAIFFKHSGFWLEILDFWSPGQCTLYIVQKKINIFMMLLKANILTYQKLEKPSIRIKAINYATANAVTDQEKEIFQYRTLRVFPSDFPTDVDKYKF